MRLFAEQQAKIGKDSWHYFFTHDPLYDPDKRDLGSAHTGEIPYVFDNLAAPRTFPGGSSVDADGRQPARGSVRRPGLAVLRELRPHRQSQRRRACRSGRR